MASLTKWKDYYRITFYDRSREKSQQALYYRQDKHNKSDIYDLMVDLERDYKAGKCDPWTEDVSPYLDPGKNISLNSAMDKYIAYKTERDWSPNTQYNNKFILRDFLEMCGSQLPAYKLDSKHINDYVNRNSIAYASKKTHKSRLLTFARWLKDNEYAGEDLVIDDVQIFQDKSHQKKKITYLSKNELETLKTGIRNKVDSDFKKGHQNNYSNSYWLIDLIDWQVKTGMRITETLELRAKDINTNNWMVTIGNTNYSPKTQIQDQLPIKDLRKIRGIAKKYLQQCESPNSRVFQHKSRSNASDNFRFYRKMFLPNRPEIDLHSLRHTCCIHLLRKGVPLYTVSRWMRHKDIKTTQRYADLLKEDISSEIGKAFEDL